MVIVASKWQGQLKHLNEVEELLAIADSLAELKNRFIKENPFGLFLTSDDQSRFTAQVLEARTIVGEVLGHTSDFAFGITNAMHSGKNTFVGGPSLQGVSDVEALIRGAVRHVERKIRNPAIQTGATTRKAPYVDESRIYQVRALQSDDWDFTKLVQLCVELNAAHQSDSRYATAMLVRAITDHVPPLFQCDNFSELAAKYDESGSVARLMRHLDESLRDFADGFLRDPIRPRETLPSEEQVDFRPALDALLAEIVRNAQ